MYRPPQGNVNNCVEKLKYHLEKVYKKKTMHIVIMGDFNVDFAKTESIDLCKKLRAFQYGYFLQ